MELELSSNQREILENCRQKHLESCGDFDDEEVYYVLKPNSFVVFRAPKKAEIQRFKGTVSDDKRNAHAKANADWELAQSVILHPPKGEQEKLFGKRPLLLTEVAAEALAIASDSETKVAKKYETAS